AATGGLPALAQKALLGTMAATAAPALVQRARQGDVSGAVGEGLVMAAPLALHGAARLRARSAASTPEASTEPPLKPLIRPDAQVGPKRAATPAAPPEGYPLPKQGAEPGVMQEPNPLPRVPQSLRLSKAAKKAQTPPGVT